MKLNNQKIYLDCIKKINRLGISQRIASKQLGISRYIFFRLNKNKPIHIDSFLKIVDWLEGDLDDYVIRTKRPEYIEKRLQKRL